MSLVTASFAHLPSWQASPAVLAIGFSVLLVLSLVAAEEIEVRRVEPSGTAEG